MRRRHAGWWLTAIPVGLLVLFAQSAWWTSTLKASNVEHIDPQAGTDNASRARPLQFVEAMTGDASTLNPILSADSASSRVVEQVFEGLLTYDENLELAPGLAESWQLEHRAYAALHGPACAPPGADAIRLREAVEVKLRATFDEQRPAVQLLAVDEAPAHLAAADEANAEQPAPAAYLAVTLPRVEPALEGMLADSFAASNCAGLNDTRLSLLHRPTVTFVLRRGVQWHDGEAFDAGDVRFTYEAIMDEATLSPRRSDYEPVAALRALDAHTVEVVYRDLYSPGLSIWVIGLLPEHLLNADALRAQGGAGPDGEAPSMANTAFNRAPIGTGPFRFVAWHSNREIELERSPTYWRNTTLSASARGMSLQRFVLRIMPDVFARELEFLAGGLDSYTPEPYQVERYASDTANRLLSGPGFSYAYIGYNATRPPFDDPRVRRALGLAINADDIIEYVLYGLGERSTGPFARETPWNDPDIAPLPYDPQAAVRLLREAGFERGPDGWLARDGKPLTFNLITNNGNEKRRAILSIVQDAWRRIGVQVNTQVFEWSVFLKDFVNTGEFDALVLGWRMTPDFDLYQIWHSSQVGGRKLNFIGYRNDDADRLMEDLRREYDGERIKAGARALHALIAADQPYTFLYSQRVTRAMANSVVDVDARGLLRAPEPSNTGSSNIDLWRWRRGAVMHP